jgi:hypothetical protein
VEEAVAPAPVAPDAATAAEREVARAAEPAPEVPALPEIETRAGPVVGEGGKAVEAGEALTPDAPPVASATETVPPEAEVAAVEPAPNLAPGPEEGAVMTAEPPLAAPVEAEQVATVPEELAPAPPATLEAAPLPEISPPEPILVQAEEPAPAEAAAMVPSEAVPEGPIFETPPTSAGEEDTASEAPGEEPALPGRLTVGGRSFPGSDAVRVNRPGAEEEPAREVAEEEAVPEAAEAVPALRRFAAAWEAPAEGKPLMSLVLLDDGTTDPEAVAALPWPVGVAIDPSREGAAERLAAYRAKGIEALVLAELPTAAQPVDVEVFLGAALDELPDTVAVLDLGQGGLGGSDATAQMGMSRVARDGRGLVLGNRGFRSGLELAGREGVPAAEVLRDLDGQGQDGAAIRRGLDDAVRRAGQEGRAVVVARATPDTLAALGEWSLEGRAQEVTVAPVSAVLGAE